MTTERKTYYVVTGEGTGPGAGRDHDRRWCPHVRDISDVLLAKLLEDFVERLDTEARGSWRPMSRDTLGHLVEAMDLLGYEDDDICEDLANEVARYTWQPDEEHE